MARVGIERMGHLTATATRSILIRKIAVGTAHSDWDGELLVTLMLVTTGGEGHAVALELPDADHLIAALKSARGSVSRAEKKATKALAARALQDPQGARPSATEGTE